MGGGPPSNYDTIVIVHATLMGAAFVLFMPLGVFLIRLTSFKGLVWAHAGIQIFAYVVALAAFGLGAWMATVDDKWLSSNGHPIIGTIVIGLLVIQPALGYVHHLIYVKEHRRTIWAISHVWYGRMLILLAVINGGLGLQLSDNTTRGEIAYGVIAGVMFLLYLAVLAIAHLRKDKSPVGETGEKMVGGPNSEKSDDEMPSLRGDVGTNGPTNNGSTLAAGTGNDNITHPKSDQVENFLDRDRSGPVSKNAGPHQLSLANKLDPNVDSDRDGRPRRGPRDIEHATAGHDEPLSVRNE